MTEVAEYQQKLSEIEKDLVGLEKKK